MTVRDEDCARTVLDVVPLVMRTIRHEMRSQRAAGLSVPQFRALVFLDRQAGASLSDLARHLGLTPPSTSKLTDGLVNRELVRREIHSRDRRRIALALTPAGEAILNTAISHTQGRLAGMLSSLSGEQLEGLTEAMRTLRVACGADRQPWTDFKE